MIRTKKAKPSARSSPVQESDFIGMASHQIRTPLAVANLQVDMLLAGHAGPLSTDQRELVEEISFYHQKMNAVLAEFLTASRIELGTFVTHTRPTDLILKIELAIRELRGDIKHKKIKLIKEYPDDLPFVMTDPEVMRIVFHRLISNAIKYTPAGGEVTVTVERKSRQIMVTIKDSGSGIAVREQAKIFSKLYQGENTKLEKSSRVGFGLYVVKALLDLCGCTIAFVSRPGKGAEFNVHIPASLLQQ